MNFYRNSVEMPLHLEGALPVVSGSLIERIHTLNPNGLHFSLLASSVRVNEADLVRGVLQILQGFSCSLFYWDLDGQQFHANTGIYVSHISQKSLNYILEQFLCAASCLQSVKAVVDTAETSSRLLPPTLRAFLSCASNWIERLRAIAIKEEVMICSSDMETTATLLGLTGTLASLCSGAEHLWRIVRGAIPPEFIDHDVSVSASLIATHILDHLYEKLNEACLVKDGEDEAYQMILYLFVGSLLPYIEVLDSWIYEGILDDPFEELFFFANKAVLVDEIDFWEKSYSLKWAQYNKLNPEISAITCAAPNDSSKNRKKEIAGKKSTSVKGNDCKDADRIVCPTCIKEIVKPIVSAGKSLQLIQHTPRRVSTKRGAHSRPECFNNAIGNQFLAGLTLSEIFCVSVAGLIGEGDYIFSCILQDDTSDSKILHRLDCSANNQDFAKNVCETLPTLQSSEKFWCKILIDTLSQKGVFDLEARDNFLDFKKNILAPPADFPLHISFCPANPVLTVCREVLNQNKDTWDSLNISRNFYLPPLKDAKILATKEPNCGFEFQYHESLRSKDDIKQLEEMLPFPTLLPFCQEEQDISELLPFQNNSTLPSRVLRWIQSVEPKATPLPAVLVQECLVQHISKQVDYIGRDMLWMLMNGWRLMDELCVLRAVYLLGSGDLLQHFLAVIFNKLDKGESWDEDFELNTILQESIRISCDGMLLDAPDSLVVSIAKHHDQNVNVQHNAASKIVTESTFGINGLHSLNFAYKVPWPLELIANTEAIKKYNQVMGFLLKVKRAKYVLDKTRQWIWKGRGISRVNCKHHWLVEQKLLHFVDAFHQYVMDRVYHSAWRELCERMGSARSLDEVIEVHNSYLLSIQRQCFVVPDKLWAMMARRINTILGLALDFHSLHQKLTRGAAISKERCRMEAERIEKQLDDCIAFLLRVLSLKISSVGQFSHLADLVTRINYNYFFHSESCFS